MMGRKQEVVLVQAQEVVEIKGKMWRKLSQDSGVDDDVEGGECQELAEVYREQKIAVGAQIGNSNKPTIAVVLVF